MGGGGFGGHGDAHGHIVGASVRAHVSRTYGDGVLKEIEKSTGDDLEQRGVKLSLWSRIRRWWFGWKSDSF